MGKSTKKAPKAVRGGKQSSLHNLNLLPTLPKPASVIGLFVDVLGSFWESCPAADTEKIYKCAIREFEAGQACATSNPLITPWKDRHTLVLP